MNKEDIQKVIDWMNEWEQLKDTVIPIRFKEDFSHPEQGEQGRIKQLEEGIGKFIQWMKEKRPHVSGLGAPISILESLIEGIEFYWQPKLSSPPPEGQDELWDDLVKYLNSYNSQNESGQMYFPTLDLKSKYLLIKK